MIYPGRRQALTGVLLSAATLVVDATRTTAAKTKRKPNTARLLLRWCLICLRG